MRNSESVISTGALLGDSPLKINRRVISAMVLRELLTRYGRNNIGFLWLFVEPMLFTTIITIIWTATRTIHGASIPIIAFAVTGYSSLLMWRRMANRSMGALQSNRPLLYHRQVTVVDVFFARLILEFIATSMSFVVLSCALISVGLLDLPENALQVVGGWLLLGWFGMGLGLMIGSLSEKSDVVKKLWPPLSYTFMPLSGVAFVVDALPPNVQQLVSWLPMLNALEFLREGWFGSAFHAHYDVPYVIVFDLLLFCVALSVARQVNMNPSDSSD